MKCLGIGIGGEVAALSTPACHGVDYSADELASTPFPFTRIQYPVEVLGGDDVGGHLGQARRDFHVLLFENDLALFVADDGIANLPFNGVIGGNPWFGERSVESEAV